MTTPIFDEIATAFSTPEAFVDWPQFSVTGEGDLPSWFDGTGLAVASIGIAGTMLSRLTDPADPPLVTVDRRLASQWFDMTLRHTGWNMPSPWDPVAGNYRSADGWIRLHTNAPHHRAAALSMLGTPVDREAVATAVSEWQAVDLETAVVEAGGCAAQMRGLDAWSNHPQGRAVAAEPLIHWSSHAADPAFRVQYRERPLAGLRVLDLTRMLAGPVGGRFLAAYGADVLRIDPADWDEPGVVPEVTLGKRCARLDLKDGGDRAIFERLLAEADVFLHGYRADALDRLGYDAEAIRHINPRIVDVALNAYGWTGPWTDRRGFDSLMQMSSGIAAHGMAMAGANRPKPLPVQALDHATGYFLAVAVLHALAEGIESGGAMSARLSLARTARLLADYRRDLSGNWRTRPKPISIRESKIPIGARPGASVTIRPVICVRPRLRSGVTVAPLDEQNGEPVEHHGVQYMPHEVGAHWKRAADRIVGHTKADGDGKDDCRDQKADRRGNVATAHQETDDEDRKQRRQIARGRTGKRDHQRHGDDAHGYKANRQRGGGPGRQCQVVAQGEIECCQNEHQDWQRIRRSGPARGEGMEQKRAYADDPDPDGKEQSRRGSAGAASPNQKGQDGGDDEGQIGHGVDRFRPEGRIDALAIIVDRFVQW